MDHSRGPSSQEAAGGLSKWIVAAQERRRQHVQAIRQQRPHKARPAVRQARKRRLRAAVVYGVGLLFMVITLLVMLSRG
jgi:hypothetical protein